MDITQGILQQLLSWFNVPYTNYPNAALSTTGQVISTTACSVFQWNLINTNSVPVYVKLYDKATAATSGDTPIAVLEVPATYTVFNGNTAAPNYQFKNGLSVRCCTGLPDNDTNAPVTALYISILYK